MHRLSLNDSEYLTSRGLDVMLAHDYYPESHQGGVGFILHGKRIATNGDIRLEPMPGQWSPVPKVGPRVVDRQTNEISVRMQYPDAAKDRVGFNPIEYPDFEFAYEIRLEPIADGFRITVDFDGAVPDEWLGKVGFNMELFPGYLFGKSWLAGASTGRFERQPSGTELEIAHGTAFVVAPECEESRTEFVSVSGEIALIDGRSLHNNGWFVLRELVAAGKTKAAIIWDVKPTQIPDWISAPVVQISQVGYHPSQPKVAVIELDINDASRPVATLHLITENGPREVRTLPLTEWGRFLRYQYLQADFSDVTEAGSYFVKYGGYQTEIFQIGATVFTTGVWQPTVEYFLPVQMCHMRVEENYRVWHGACHLDDAQMAPTDLNHFDGYTQGDSTLTSYDAFEVVPGLNVGGWHDAGDYDLRVESQADTVWGLALAYEEFQLDFDNTTVNQAGRRVQLLKPDGVPDILQQIEHGVLSIVGGYRTLGRLYRGIIEQSLEQYTHLGDAATQTDNRATADDRWVFTEENEQRELSVAAALSAASRVLVAYKPRLAKACLDVAQELYRARPVAFSVSRFAAALELLICTGAPEYSGFITSSCDEIHASIADCGWLVARSRQHIYDGGYRAQTIVMLAILGESISEQAKRTPYGIPYEPDIWGAGWGIQRFGFEQYWLHCALTQLFPIEYMYSAINFVLGCHPGSNTASFVSGVGSKSLLQAYGVNRAEFSYIPGGIGSGTALIRPDYPELLEWPYLWQQTEYCVGRPTADYVFIVAAADFLLNLE